VTYESALLIADMISEVLIGEMIEEEVEGFELDSQPIEVL